jgi:predicted phage terminase large subunit-like protein
MSSILTKRDHLNAIMRTDFKSFAVKVFNELNGGTEFIDNFHYDLICSRLMDMHEGYFDRMAINIPPRYGKSIFCSIAWPAWLLGKNPETRVICVSYADKLSKKLARNCRSIMQTNWYRDLFPNTIIDPSCCSAEEFETTAGGGRFSTSVGGTVTGFGANWIIIDDPIKASDAKSEVQRQTAIEFLDETLYGRLDDKVHGKIMLIMQRLHENDLTGHFVDKEPNCVHIQLSVIAEGYENWLLTPQSSKSPRYKERQKGDLLHPEREDQETLDKLRFNLGERAFASQYQQVPMPISGGLVKSIWLRHYDKAPDRYDRIVHSWDTAQEVGLDNAYSACVRLGVKGDTIFVLGVFRYKLAFPDLLAKIQELQEEARNSFGAKIENVIEDASSGTYLIQVLPKHCNITASKPKGEKSIRLMGITPHIVDGTVRFPSAPSLWWKDFEKELLTFPASKFADQVDALSQGVTHIISTRALSAARRDGFGAATAHTGTGGRTRFGAVTSVDGWAATGRDYTRIRFGRK